MHKSMLWCSGFALLTGFAAGAVHTLDYRAPAKSFKSLSAASALRDGELRRAYIPASAAPSVSPGFAVGDEIALRLFEGADITLTLRERTPAPLGGASFLAEAAGYDGVKNAVVVVTDDGCQIDVQDYLTGKVYTVFSSADGVTVREVKPPEEPCTCGTPELMPPGATNVTGQTQHLAAQRSLAAASAQQSSGPVYVDILVAYDTMAASWAKSNGGGLQNFAEVQVQKMNTAIANTGLDAYYRYRLVGTYEIGGSAGGGLQYALEFAAGARMGTFNGVSWADIAIKRDECLADIVCVLIDTGSATGTTGIGYSLMPSTANPASCGYNACAIRAVANTHTMTHEVGHNMGAGHSDAMADKSNCGPQYHSYSRGYYFYIGSTGYYTIMAYNADGYGNYYTSVPYFSSPDYKYNGVAVGNATHDNTKTLRQLFATVANNRYVRDPLVSAEVGVGLDAEAYVWTTDWTYPWALSTSRKADGVDSASSSLTPSVSASWAETKVVGPATLSFKYWLVSYYGQFRVTCDGVTLFSYGSASKNTQMQAWAQASGLAVPSGVHTIRFMHVNNQNRYYQPANAVWVDQVVFSGGQPYVESAVPSLEGDSGATVTGNAASGFVIVPSAGVKDVTVTIPTGLDPSKVTVEVSTDVETVRPNGASVRVKKGANDITAFLDIPAINDNGVVDMRAATVKGPYVREAMDVSQGAVIVLNPDAPSLTTPKTQLGLTYTLHEGMNPTGLSAGASKLGDGQTWTPPITVRGGTSGFYSIRVTK